MALQLWRVLTSSALPRNLSNQSNIYPQMLQYSSVQNFPFNCLSCSPFSLGKNFKIHAGLKVKRKIWMSGDVDCNFKLTPQFRFDNLSLCGNLEPQSTSNTCGLASKHVSRRLFTSSCRKKFCVKVKSKDSGDALVMEDKNQGEVNSSLAMIPGTKKKEKTKTSCHSIDGETNVAVSELPTQKTIWSGKIVTGTADNVENNTEIVQDVKKKKEPAKRRTSAQATISSADSKKANGKKINSKKQNTEVFASASASSKAKVTTKLSRKKGASESYSLHEANREATNVRSRGIKNDGGQLKPLYPPSGRSVVVVESVTKAKVIQNYLGDMYEVLPSYGHVRDLAARSRSVRPDNDFSIVWEVPTAAWTHLKSIKDALNGAENLILASDPDREGEAIAWHINEMLKQQDALNGHITVSRVVFHEITESSIKNALQTPRLIDMNLVNAYLARRALDYLIGFSISPLLWRKLPGCQSAGRVQAAALALICDRETEIEQFNAQEYWTIDVEFRQCSSLPNRSASITSHLTHLNSKKLNQLSISAQGDAEDIERQISSTEYRVKSIRTSKVQRSPPTPYITSTLQQDSANKLHFTAVHTMKLAQKLYEGIKLSNEEATGLITYMRTDGLHVSNEAAEAIHSLVKERYGVDYASKNIRKYFKKVKNAQEAHEAIRPTDVRRLPSTLGGILDDDSLKLYTLIWVRTVACQMEAAINDVIQVDVGNAKGDMMLHSVGSRVAFLGYQAVYQDTEAQTKGADREDEDKDAHDVAYETLQKLKVDDPLNLVKVHPYQHYTQPAPRYSEGSLVKKLEELGIGRPSTYASIMKVLQDRNYITVKSRVLHPEFRGRMVSSFLSHHFSEVADYSFTADMENELDNVSAGETEWKGLLKDYWSRFSKYCDLASSCNIGQVEKMLEETFGHILFDSLSSRVCPSCALGTLKFKVSRFGAGYYIGCDQHPKCKYIASTMGREDDEAGSPEKLEKSFPPKLLGVDPGSGEKIYLKKGPYGYYFQLGEDRKEGSPKRATIFKVKDVEAITLEDAVEMLQYPIQLGNHPDDKHPVLLTHGKFGFSIKHRSTLSTVPKSVDPKKITLEAGLKLLSSKNVTHLGRPKGKPKSEESS